MPFEKRAGLAGKVYVPPVTEIRKHTCPDCFNCQICSDDRCTICRGEKERRPPQGGNGTTTRGGRCRCRAR